MKLSQVHIFYRVHGVSANRGTIIIHHVFMLSSNENQLLSGLPYKIIIRSMPPVLINKYIFWKKVLGYCDERILYGKEVLLPYFQVTRLMILLLTSNIKLNLKMSILTKEISKKNNTGIHTHKTVIVKLNIHTCYWPPMTVSSKTFGRRHMFTYARSIQLTIFGHNNFVGVTFVDRSSIP